MSVKDILGSEPGTDKRREALKEWNTRHAGKANLTMAAINCTLVRSCPMLTLYAHYWREQPGTSVFSTFVSETEKAEVLQELLRCIANENLSIDGSCVLFHAALFNVVNDVCSVQRGASHWLLWGCFAEKMLLWSQHSQKMCVYMLGDDTEVKGA